MTMELASAWLEQQHQRIDAGILGVLDGSGTQAQLRHALMLLRAHLHLEETVLFPVLEAANLAMPVFVMKREHGQMWPLLQRLVADEADALDDGSRKALCGDLNQLLQIHNGKEEQILYTVVDRLVAEGDEDLALASLERVRAPQDWLPAAAARQGPR